MPTPPNSTKEIASDRQAEALKKIGPHEVIKTHDDGDLTIKDAHGCLHVITTEGELFTDFRCHCGCDHIEKLAALLRHLECREHA